MVNVGRKELSSFRYRVLESAALLLCSFSLFFFIPPRPAAFSCFSWTVLCPLREVPAKAPSYVWLVRQAPCEVPLRNARSSQQPSSGLWTTCTIHHFGHSTFGTHSKFFRSFAPPFNSSWLGSKRGLSPKGYSPPSYVGALPWPQTTFPSESPSSPPAKLMLARTPLSSHLPFSPS